MDLKKHHWLRYSLSGAAAGVINGFFGAGGGMVLVPMLIRFCGLEDKEAFSSAIGIIFPICLISIAVYWAQGIFPIEEALPYLIGGLIGGWAGYAAAFTPGQAFFLVLVSGLCFMLLSVIKIKGKTFREMVFDGMPVPVRGSISVGIGLFIAYIGFQNAGVIVSDPYTQVALVNFTNWDACKAAVVALIGLFLIAILDKLKVKGSVILGILAATLIGIPVGVTDLSILQGNVPGISWKFWENFANFFTALLTTRYSGVSSSFCASFKCFRISICCGQCFSHFPQFTQLEAAVEFFLSVVQIT
jgi:uncharacterized membrane protein YfcA